EHQIHFSISTVYSPAYQLFGYLTGNDFAQTKQLKQNLWAGNSTPKHFCLRHMALFCLSRNEDVKWVWTELVSQERYKPLCRLLPLSRLLGRVFRTQVDKPSFPRSTYPLRIPVWDRHGNL